ncbi:MAG: hypothetical protein WCQ54_05025 [Clostridiaceae bacterium]
MPIKSLKRKNINVYFPISQIVFIIIEKTGYPFSVVVAIILVMSAR